MSADEEPTSAPTDTPMSEPQSNKRKASIDGELEKEAPTPPKRAKLEQPETEATPTTTEDNRPQEPVPAPKKEDDATPPTPERRADPKPSPKGPSPPPQSASPRQSRSPTLSRRPSIPAPSPNPPPGPGPDRTSRTRITEQEKKRGQRLFGGLLSTLSQRTPNNNPQAKKRVEIEKRQHERAQQQRAEDGRRRAEKLARLTHVRRVAQVALEERMMRTRHRSMLLQARCLATRAEPRLFYLPWKLTEAQEKQLAQQAEDTERLIAREVERFQCEKVRRLKELGVEVDESKHPAELTDKDQVQPPRKLSATHEKPNEKVTLEEASHDKSNHDHHHEDPDYVTVENEEDTVIY